MKAHILGGGTVYHVRPHLALCAPAQGTLARDIVQLLWGQSGSVEGGITAHLHLTKMAYHGLRHERNLIMSSPLRPCELVVNENPPDTNADVARILDEVVADPAPSVVFMTAALCDFEGSILDGNNLSTRSGKKEPRLKSRAGDQMMVLTPAEKVLMRVRSKEAPKPRKDIFLVACKTTAGATEDEMFLAGLTLLKTASANLVLVNDVHTRVNMIVTPEQARYAVTTDRRETIATLVMMAVKRSQGHFTRTKVVHGETVDWNSPEVPENLRAAVNHCIKQGAYKDLLGRNATVGHFAAKVGENQFLTSKRNSNFNHMDTVGLVRVEAVDDTLILAHGARPSVGGQSQRIIFRDHPETDAIVHFHCPLRPDAPDRVPVKSQFENECGSHECGQNTSDGLLQFGRIKAVMLDKHGPNIVFPKDVPAEDVIAFIDRNFDLSLHTGM